MQLPPELERKFQALLERYPVKRSALVPMALYAQDLFGFVSEELVEEIARDVLGFAHPGDRVFPFPEGTPPK